MRSWLPDVFLAVPLYMSPVPWSVMLVKGLGCPVHLLWGSFMCYPGRVSVSVWLKVWFGECLLYKGSMGQGVLPLPSSYALKLLWCLSPIQPGLPRMFRVGFGFSDRRNP